jgi:RND family efflux transporter MFP subunit
MKPSHLKQIAFLAALGAATAVAAAETLETAEVIQTNVVREHVADGVVEAVKQGTVAAQTSGRVQEVNFDVDDYVPKGAVIVRFRDKEQQAGLQVAAAGVKEAEARYAEAEAEFRRIKDVFEKQVVPRSALDKATADQSAARQRLDAAQARFTQAQEQLEHTVVRAPYSGIVVKRHIEVGENANPGQPLMSGFALDELRVTANVAQSAIQAIRTHNRARIEFPTQGGRVVDAKSLRIFPFAEAQSHTYRVRLNLAPGQEGLLPGMYAKVAFFMDEEARTVIPARALVQRGELDAVYVVATDGRIALRQVRVGRRVDENTVEVLAGLDAGERVALDPIRAGVALKEQLAARP